jgi:hypothetical protein
VGDRPADHASRRVGTDVRADGLDPARHDYQRPRRGVHRQRWAEDRSGRHHPVPDRKPASRIRFPSQTATDSATARIPQDISVAPALTQALLDDPNSLLLSHIAGMNIVSTDVIIIDTQSAAVSGGGTDNIGFLGGDAAAGPNANAVQMSAIFWIETVQARRHGGAAQAR